MTWLTWCGAMQEALYGVDGFYRRALPADHFRTSVTAGPLFASAVRELADRVDASLGRPDPFDVVDLGAGGGELLQGLGSVPARWRLTGVELSGRFSPHVPAVTGLLIANEWLDNVPLDVLQDGHLVEVRNDGTERPGVVAPAADLAWAQRWWPAAERVELGRTREAAWATAVAHVDQGLAVAIDYGHVQAERRTTLTGYRDGRQVPPVPDGTCDLTAHVALDACAAATGAALLTQRGALTALGLSGARPDPGAPGYLAELARASHAATLLDPAGLGGFGWLVQPVGVPSPL